MERKKPQTAAVGCYPTASLQTDPPPRDAEEEFPAADSVTPETLSPPPQSLDAGVGPGNRQGVESVSMSSRGPQRSKNGRKSARDYADADILPMMRKNRERGQRTFATAVHKYLVRTYGEDLECQLRTVQRLVCALNKSLDEEHKQGCKNPDNALPEIFFCQKYDPGKVAQFDCTSVKNLGITIDGRPYDGKIFTFKMMYSKWIYASVVSGETEREVLDAIQDALWALNGVPQQLRSDNGKALFTKAHEPNTGYRDLSIHYGTTLSPINAGHPNENGGAENANKSVKGLLRDRLTTDFGSEFESVEQLCALLKEEVDAYNAGLQRELKNERQYLKRLPKGRVEPYELVERMVNKEGLIRFDGRRYSVPADLHGKRVPTQVYNDRLVIYDDNSEPAWEWPLETDLEGRVDFRHIIHWLQRKPHSFDSCWFKEQLFPSENFLETHRKFREWYEPSQGDKDYLSILQAATGSGRIRQSPDGEELIAEVHCALELLLESGERFNFSHVTGLVETGTESGETGGTSAVRQQTMDFRRVAKV